MKDSEEIANILKLKELQTRERSLILLAIGRLNATRNRIVKFSYGLRVKISGKLQQH